MGDRDPNLAVFGCPVSDAEFIDRRHEGAGIYQRDSELVLPPEADIIGVVETEQPAAPVGIDEMRDARAVGCPVFPGDLEQHAPDHVFQTLRVHPRHRLHLGHPESGPACEPADQEPREPQADAEHEQSERDEHPGDGEPVAADSVPIGADRVPRHAAQDQAGSRECRTQSKGLLVGSAEIFDQEYHDQRTRIAEQTREGERAHRTPAAGGVVGSLIAPRPAAAAGARPRTLANLAHRGLDRVGALVAAFAFLLERSKHHVVEAHVDLDLLRRRCEAADGQLAGEHLVKDHAEREDVGAVVDFPRLADLFGRHVVERAHDLCVAGERGVLGAGLKQLGQTEVGDLHMAGAVEEDVVGLDVAVDHALVVGVLERVANLGHHAERLGGCELAGFLRLAEVHAVHVFHDEVKEIARLARLVDEDDVGVAQLGEGARLAGEALGKGRVGGHVAGEDLERHDPIERTLAGLVDDAHAALADQLEDLEVGEGGGEFFVGEGRWIRVWRINVDRVEFGIEADLEQAGGAAAARGVGRDGTAAF